MNVKKILLLLALCLLLTANAGAESDWEALAREHLPQDAVPVSAREEDGEWEMRFRTDTEKYEITVNPDTGKVSEVESERVPDAGGAKVVLTTDDVRGAVERLYPGAKITMIVLHEDDGLYEYKIWLQRDDMIGEIRLHPENGEVLKRELFFTSAYPAREQTGAGISTDGINDQQARALALEKAGDGYVTKCELDWKKGQLIFEVEVRTAQAEYEAEIDAITGEILKWEKDD